MPPADNKPKRKNAWDGIFIFESRFLNIQILLETLSKTSGGEFVAYEFTRNRKLPDEPRAGLYARYSARLKNLDREQAKNVKSEK